VGFALGVRFYYWLLCEERFHEFGSWFLLGWMEFRSNRLNLLVQRVGFVNG
jgi:hypothetical protein